MEWLIPVLVVVAILVIVAAYLWVAYRSLIQLRVRVDASWDDILGHLRTRAQALPSLVEVVGQVASHEKSVLAAVSDAGRSSAAADDPQAAATAEADVQRALASLFRMTEAYPQLMTSEDFLGLQQEMNDAEARIQAGRRLYNGGVRELNAKASVFPGRVVAHAAGVTERPFFESAAPAVSAPPRVQF